MHAVCTKYLLYIVHLGMFTKIVQLRTHLHDYAGLICIVFAITVSGVYTNPAAVFSLEFINLFIEVSILVFILTK